MPANACSECGAPQAEGSACIDCFHALLAFENERAPAFGAVHHLTVACYFLQHPAGYGPEILTMWRASVADALDGRATTRELQARAGSQFSGSRRVRDPNATAPVWWPRQWPMTVHDVLRPGEPLPSVEEYIHRARRWASETRSHLDDAAREAEGGIANVGR